MTPQDWQDISKSATSTLSSFTEAAHKAFDINTETRAYEQRRSKDKEWGLFAIFLFVIFAMPWPSLMLALGHWPHSSPLKLLFDIAAILALAGSLTYLHIRVNKKGRESAAAIVAKIDETSDQMRATHPEALTKLDELRNLNQHYSRSLPHIVATSRLEQITGVREAEKTQEMSRIAARILTLIAFLEEYKVNHFSGTPSVDLDEMMALADLDDMLFTDPSEVSLTEFQGRLNEDVEEAQAPEELKEKGVR